MLYRFNVFGQIIAIERVGDAWAAHLVGNEGKRRPAGLAIPPDVNHAELPQYLYDIYHESATPTNGDVFEISPGQNGYASQSAVLQPATVGQKKTFRAMRLRTALAL